MATHNYTFYIQNTEPSNPQLFNFWLNQDTGQVHLYLSNEWTVILSAGKAITATPGIYWRELLDQTAEPTGQNVGDGWLSDANQAYMYLDDWYPWAGA